MTLPVVFRRRAQSDLAGTFDWYEEQRSGLGEELLSAVQSTSKSIGRYPEMFASVRGAVRRAMISKFPFAMFIWLSQNALLFSGCCTPHVTQTFGPALGDRHANE